MSRYRQTMAEALNQVRVRDNNIEEGRMKDIFTADQEGKSAKEIAKLLNIPLKTVKSILGEAGIKPYVSMQRDSKTGKMNYVVLDKDEKEAFKSTDQKVATDYWKKNYDKLKEETIVEFSDSMLDKLKKEYEPLKGKTISVDQANKLRKIFSMIPDRALDALRRKKIPFLSGLALSRMVQKGMPVREEIELDEASSAEVMKKAKEFGITAKMTPKGIDVSAFKSQDGMEKFMKYVASQGKNMLTKEEIEEKIQSFMISYSKNGQHAGFKGADSLPELQRMAANLRMRGFTIDKMGRYNPPVKKEEVNETPQGYALVQKAKEIAKKMANNYSGAVKEIEKLQKGLSDNSSVQAALLKANEQVEQIEKMPKEEPKKDNEKKESENKDNTISSLKDQIAMLKTKLENEKNKAVKPEPNPDTGEVPLTVGVAYKALRDKMKKEEVKDNPDIVDDNETKKEKSKGKALTGSPKTVVDTDPKVDYKN